MAEEIKPTLTAPLDVKPIVDTKTADKPVVDAGKPADTAKPAVDIAKPVETKTTDKPADVKPAEELKSLLDEASEEEVKLGPDGKPLPKAEAKGKVVPDKYEFKLPENMSLSDAQRNTVEAKFKELGLDNEGAQKLVDMQLELNKANEDAHVQAWETYLETQKTQAKEYFGTKLPEVMRNMARARDTFIPKNAEGKSPLLDKFNAAGFSNDKDFIEFMDRVGRVIGEGKFVEGKRSAPAKGDGSVEVKGPTMADVYPSMAKT